MLRRVFIFSGIACLVVAGVAFGANTGRLSGQVMDNEGVPLPGVTVQITSDFLIGGPQVAITGVDGEFAFHLLQVGDYTVEANLAGFRPAAGEVRVSADQVAMVNFRMIPEQFGGEIEVSAEVPVVDTSQVNSRQVWDQDYLQYATIGTANRSYQSVLSQAAGVTGGSNPNVFGSTVGENAYLIDGMNTTDPVTGTWSTMFNIDAVQELNFQTGGFEAEFGQATGGIVNLVTKSGGNQFSGSLDLRFRDEDMTESGDHYDKDLISESRKQASATLGGPFVRDKLWFFTSYQYIDSQSQDWDAAFPYEWVGWQFLGKMTWQASEGNRMILKFSTDPAVIDGVNSSWRALGDARGTQEQGGDIWQAELNSVLSESWLLNAQVGVSSNYLDQMPTDNSDESPGHLNEDTDLFYNNYRSSTRDERPRDEYRVNATYFVDNLAGSHEFKAGAEYSEIEFDNAFWYNGGAYIRDFEMSAPGFDAIDLNGDGYAGNGFMTIKEPEETVKDPVNSQGDTTTFFIQDAWRPHPNLTIKPGVRYDNIKMTNHAGTEISDMEEIQPRFGIAWDILGDARHVIRASGGRFMDSTALNIPSFASGIDEVYHDYNTLEFYCNSFRGAVCDPAVAPPSYGDPIYWTAWDGNEYILYDNRGDTVYDPAQTLDQAGFGQLEAPFTDEIIIAYETQIAPQTSIELTYIDKETDDIIEDTCIGNAWAYGAAPLPSLDDPSTWTTGSDCDGWLIVNMDLYERSYEGVILKFETRKQWGNIIASYTNSESKGTNISGPRHYAYGDGDFFPVNFYNMYGYLDDHREHRVKLNGYFLLPKRFTVGFEGFWSSEGHETIQSSCTSFLGVNNRSERDQMEALGIDPATQDYCSTSGVSGSYTIFHSPRGSLKTKSIWQLDMQVTKGFRIGGADVEAILSVFNVFGNEFDRTFNENAFRQETDPLTHEALNYQDDDPNAPYYDEYYGVDNSPVLVPIGSALTYWDPRRYEIGVRIEF